MAMAKPHLQIRISGINVSPEMTRAGDLADILKGIEAAIEATARGQGVELPDDEVSVSLVGVEESSNKLTIAVVSTCVAAAAQISGTVASGEYGEIPRKAHEALYDVSQKSLEREWEVRFEENASLHVRAATISSQNEVPALPAPTVISGTTTIYGHCVRVGGARTPRAELRLGNRRTIDVHLSQELAKELGKILYEEVAITGEATWDAEDWSIRSLEATRIMPYRPTDLLVAFDELADLSKGRWGNVDASEYVRVLRSEDSEA